MQDHRRSLHNNQAMETAGIRAAAWVVGKALSPLSGGVLEAWAASTKLGTNLEALKIELLHTQAILENAHGREIHNPALGGLLDKLRLLASGADDTLDELDYFRIQDELDGTYHAADVHAAGCVQDLALTTRHTARACMNRLKFPICKRAARHDEEDDGDKKGCLSNAAHNVGKHFSCFSLLPSVSQDAQTEVEGIPSMAAKNSPLQTPKLKFNRVEMSRKILDITEHLKPLNDKVSNVLSLEILNSSRSHTEDINMSRPKTTPLIIEPKLYGRDSHKKIVVDEVAISKGCELTVLPIVGPGGIGKTTFTQHVYEEMKSHFEVPIWICVSLDFNVNRLAADIVKKIPHVNSEKQYCSDEDLIKQRLKGKTVLLVLDDVWKHQENEWRKLIAMFKVEGVKGSMIIVTTRIPEVANTVKTTKSSLELDRLCAEDITSYFEECVFIDKKPWVDHLELSDVGSKIVEKLKGSPLAARTVSRLLRNNLTLNHWRNILESREWESQTDENDIMPALKLSYDYLPFHLQQCFSFCSLFSEDYEFGSEELVHLWIGLDILRSCDQTNRRVENVGLCYLNDLVNYGFFKMNEKEDGRPYYVIHDLLHQLAVRVSRHECISIYSSNVKDIRIPQSVRHLSITVNNTDVKDIMSFQDYDGNLRALDKRFNVGNLHTLMLFGDYHGNFAKTFGLLFKEARALRILSLTGVSYNVDDILHNFSKLVHLRYLRMMSVYYWDVSLPIALFRLYHLEVIDIKNVHRCLVSTRQMKNLVKLRHFLVPVKRLTFHSEIFGVRKLKFLQELREFRVGKEAEGFELSQLGPLTEIGGSLAIYNLENVQTQEEANKLKLIHKTQIRELILEWDDTRSDKDNVHEGNVLESLVPHSSLEELCIRGHGGTSCPAWLCTNLSVRGLKSLCLDGVHWRNLPPLGEMWMVDEHGDEFQGCSISPPSFHNLKRLELCNIPRLKKWVGNGTCHFLSQLEVLIIKHCSELVELPFSYTTLSEAQRDEKVDWFPKLRELVILDCPKLESLPLIPCQTSFMCSTEIEGVGSDFKRLLYTEKHKSQFKLEVVGKDGQGDVLWNGLNFCNLTNLTELAMNKIPSVPLDKLRGLTCLKSLCISDLSSILLPVEGVGHDIYRLPLEYLEIKHCGCSGKELTLLLSFLPKLSTLILWSCGNITELGVVEHAETICEEQQQHIRGEDKLMTAAAAEGLLLLPPQLQRLWMNSCEKVSLTSNGLQGDNHAREGREGGLQRLHSLKNLLVYDCPQFFSNSCSSSSFCLFPTSLQSLHLQLVGHTDTLRSLSNLTSLTELSLKDLGSSRDEGLWPLLAHGSLAALEICTSDFFTGSDSLWSHDREVFSRSSKLPYLETTIDTGFLAAPICNLFSSTLTELSLRLHNFKVERFTQEQEEALQLLTSLQSLDFIHGYSLQCLPAGLHKLINLKRLNIGECSAIESLPRLPSSLQELLIQCCRAIKSLPNSLPSSLEILSIYRCNNIKSLPKDGLPRSVRELDVCDGNSQELIRECRKLIGTIPIIQA